MEETNAPEPIENHRIAVFASKIEEIKRELQKVIVGQDLLIDSLIITFLNRGHLLIEGVPGVAKTLTANAFAKSINAAFSRIQFTPDLMPADITGTNIYNTKENNFEFRKGPVFSNIVLIDEINRAPAKTQSALFELMEERQITYDGKTYSMPSPFIVIATQNPIEQEGTYRLPEAQMDRFLMKSIVVYPSFEHEIDILNQFINNTKNNLLSTIKSVFNAADFDTIDNLMLDVFIKPELINYIVSIVSSTRNHPDIYVGASPRASLALMHIAKTVALLNKRIFTTPDDVRQFAYHVLNHRILINPESEMAGKTAKSIIEDLISKIEVPR